MKSPLQWISKQIDNIVRFDPQSAISSAPQTSQPDADFQPPTTAMEPAQTTTIVQDVPDDAINVNAHAASQVLPVANVNMLTESSKHTEHFRKIVESFDEDRLDPLEWAVRKFITIFCYLAPFVVAVFIGMAVGDQFAQGQTSWSNWGIHLLSLFLEVLMPILGLSTNIMFKRALKDRLAIGGLVAVATIFLLVSVGNSLALFVLLEKDVDMATVSMPQLIAIVFRSFGSLILDIGSTIYLTIATIRSLKKYIADQRTKIVAVRDVNAVNIELENTNMKAVMDRMIAVSEMSSKQKRMATLDEAERLTQEATLEVMRKKLTGDDKGGGRSRYGSGW